MNKITPKNNTSGHIGVSFDKTRNKWMAYIKLNGKMKNLGRYNSYEEAVAARENAEELYFKEYRLQRNQDEMEEK